MPAANFESLFRPRKPENKVCVVVSGKMFSGKTTFARMFKKYCSEYSSNINFFTMPMASPIKYLVNTYMGLTDEEGEANKSLLRADYQFVGTELLRNQYKQDFWTILALRHNEQFMLFDDVRYENEVETVKANSTLFCHYKILAPQHLRQARCDAKHGAGSWVTQDHNHTSETGLDNYTGENFLIINDCDEHHMEIEAAMYAKIFYEQYCDMFNLEIGDTI